MTGDFERGSVVFFVVFEENLKICTLSITRMLPTELGGNLAAGDNRPAAVMPGKKAPVSPQAERPM